MGEGWRARKSGLEATCNADARFLLRFRLLRRLMGFEKTDGHFKVLKLSQQPLGAAAPLPALGGQSRSYLANEPYTAS